MNKNIRTVIILVLLIVFPFLFYAILQVKSLAEDEQIANEIYDKQLETILFSLNQFADDMTDQWVRQLADEKQPISKNARALILGNESIQMLVLRKQSNQKDSVFVNDYVQIGPTTKHSIAQWYEHKDSLIDQLTRYFEAGFQKIQSAEDWLPMTELDNLQSAMTVMLYDQQGELYNAIIVLQTRYWVEQALGRNIQELAQENMRLAITQTQPADLSPRVIYATAAFDFEKDYVENPLWILPHTSLAIQAEGESYAALIRRRSQTNLYVLLSSLLIMIIGTVVVIRNIRNMMKIAQLKSDFVRNVSHEIRTPLSLIRMYSETLMLGRLPSTEKKQQYYEVIHAESGRLTYLVNNILDFSKIEANRKTYELELMDLNQLVEEIYADYLHTFKQQAVKNEIALTTEELPIMVDPQAFNEALSNLIENAIKYSDEDKYIMLKTRASKRFAFLEITDHGIGIPKSEQAQIFDRFYRIEDALTQETRGTGLGLSLVKHIMEAHDCEVQVHSIVNEGSTFTLKFPLK